MKLIIPHSFWLIFEPFRIAPNRSAFVVLCLLLAGLGEAIGVASLLPILSLATKGNGQPPTKLEQAFTEGLAFINITPSLQVLLVLMVVAIFLKSGMTMLAMSEVGITVARITLSFRRRLINALMVAKWPFFVSRPAGSLANAIGVEADGASSIIQSAYRIVAMSILTTVYMLLAMVLNPYVTLFSFIVGVILVLTFSGLVRFSRSAGARRSRANESLQTAIADGLSGIKPLRAMARERHLAKLLGQESENLFFAQRHLVLSKEALVAIREPALVLSLAPLIYLAVTDFGMPFEQMLILAYLFYRIINCVGNLQQIYQSMVGAEGLYQSMLEKIDAAEQQAEAQTGPPMPPLTNKINIKNLSLDIEETNILRDVSLVIPANSITAIVGSSGAGKSTLIDIILGFRRPTSGEIWIDGVPFADRNILSWRQQVGYVPQEMLLFHDTVRNNVTLGDENYSDEDINSALKDAGAWGFVQEMPKNLQTIVGERGTKISGGQRQRIAIARALLSKPRLLILDEPTTALDPAMEAEICDSLKSLGKNVTVLLISHQPALIAIADNVIRISRGRIVEAA